MKIYEVDISDNDIIIVEVEKDKSFVFQPLKEQDSEENKHEDFQDPLNIVSEGSEMIQTINQLDITKLLRRNSV